MRLFKAYREVTGEFIAIGNASLRRNWVGPFTDKDGNPRPGFVQWYISAPKVRLEAKNFVGGVFRLIKFKLANG